MLNDPGRFLVPLLRLALPIVALSLASPPLTAERDLPDLQQQVDQALRADGLPHVPGRTTAAFLADLASQAGQWAATTDDAAERLLAEHLRLRLFAALAHQAMNDRQPSQASYRLTQLRASAAQARRIPRPEAHALADWWLLMADLMDLQRNQSDAPTKRQVQRSHLADWLRHTAQPQHALPPALASLRPIALARAATLAHQAGDHPHAAELAHEGLRDPAANPATRDQLETAAALTASLGNPLPSTWSAPTTNAPADALILWAHSADLLDSPQVLANSLDHLRAVAEAQVFPGRLELLLAGPWPAGTTSETLSRFLVDLPTEQITVTLDLASPQTATALSTMALPLPSPGAPHLLRVDSQRRLRSLAASPEEALPPPERQNF